jgi:acetyl-CoA carboxylase biotin carboxyl carrier protein
MENKQIKELMAVMQRTGTKRLVVKKEGFEVEIEREVGRPGQYAESPVHLIEENPLRHEIAMHRANILLGRNAESSTSLNNNAEGSKNSEVAPGVFVTSPMVGTFYQASSPEDPAFIKLGDRIEKDTVVCIIEAMKVMNEVKAGVAGTVTEILVENGHPLEFGSKIFRVS